MEAVKQRSAEVSEVSKNRTVERTEAVTRSFPVWACWTGPVLWRIKMRHSGLVGLHGRWRLSGFSGLGGPGARHGRGPCRALER
jgi:hypothetical protein